ncbi:permease prefix domain 1-containing protein [Deinococcus sp. QL22]|uniref:permease prefix domain 1-containing protein n=1 Tax=Deinococcus sp. QL22 TaxID=2939437 RepID=UPI002017985C|nr:permease prefix domain 1-containing protein [Deinococcus sp. QL22]UQN10585.1 permease prefix domain 1-containing protein [Deinococcus sp. QL22]
MNHIERQIDRYIRQATRGLRGPRRQDAQQELRGALEDKIHRHRLLGLDEQAAATAALRDFGSASAVARDLNAVHTLPTVYRSVLLAGIGTLLSLQAVAQVPMVRAIPDPQVPSNSCVFNEALLKELLQADAESMRRKLAQPNGKATFEAECRASMPKPSNSLLSLTDLLAALRKGGIIVNTVPGFDGYLQLTFPGRTDIQGLNLNNASKTIGGQIYIQAGPFVHLLSRSLPLGIQLKLEGLENPILNIGSARVQLGTPTAKVRATDFYSFSLLEQLQSQLTLATGTTLKIAYIMDQGDQQGHQLKIDAPDQALFATVSNSQLVDKRTAEAQEHYLLRVRAVKGGVLPAPTYQGYYAPVPHVVNTPAELMAATAKGQEAVLVYRLNAADLQNLKLTAVPASTLKPVQKYGQ